MIRSLIPILALLGALVLPVHAQDAPTLDALNARYDQLQGLRASFTQVMTSDFSSDSTRMQGRVWLSGQKYRVETPEQTVVTDGKTTWIYSPADSQVVVNDADTDGSRITPQTFLATSAKKYKIVSRRTVSRDGAPHSRLQLTAASSTTRFSEATLWVRSSDRIVTRLRATDRNGSTLDLRLREITVNPSVAEETFRYAVPNGVEVVDLRSESSN